LSSRYSTVLIWRTKLCTGLTYQFNSFYLSLSLHNTFSKTTISRDFIIPLVSDEIFDGFICYAKEDRSFALEILTRLEAPPYCRKICIDFRDYVPGNCRLDQTAKIIEHRCKHLVAILSPNFTNSSNAGFQVRIALNLSPGESNLQR
jgi:hypothetical protein